MSKFAYGTLKDKHGNEVLLHVAPPDHHPDWHRHAEEGHVTIETRGGLYRGVVEEAQHDGEGVTLSSTLPILGKPHKATIRLTHNQQASVLVEPLPGDSDEEETSASAVVSDAPAHEEEAETEPPAPWLELPLQPLRGVVTLEDDD